MQLKYWMGRVMFRQAAILIGKQRDRAASVFRASTRALRSRGLQVLVGSVAFSGAALAQTYWLFELINSTQSGTDEHLLIGALATNTPLSSGNSFLDPRPGGANPYTPAFWSSNVDVAAGLGRVTDPPPNQNYWVTNIAFEPSTANTYGCSGACGTAGNSYVSALHMFWSDLSGNSYELVGTGGGTTGTQSWNVYNASFDGTNYSRGTQITPGGGGVFQVVFQGTDASSGRGNFGTNGIEFNYAPNLLPEINGSALPKAALLVFSLFFLYRARRCV